jgi:hypothetical protein
MAARTNQDQTGVEPFNTSVEPDGTGWAVTNRHDGRRYVISRHPNRELAEQAAVALNASGNLTDEFTAHDVLPRADGTFDA